MEIKILVMFFGFTFFFLEIGGQDVEQTKQIEKKVVKNSTSSVLNKTQAAESLPISVSVAPKLPPQTPVKPSLESTPVTPQTPVKPLEATPVTQPTDIKLTETIPVKESNSPVFCKQCDEERLKELNSQQIRNEKEPFVALNSNESNSNEVPNKEPSNDHLRRAAFEQKSRDPKKNKDNVNREGKENQSKGRRNKKTRVPNIRLNLPMLATYNGRNKNLNSVNKDIVKNGSKESITVSPIVQHVLENGTRVRTQIVEIVDSPIQEEHQDVASNSNVTSGEVNNVSQEVNNLMTEAKRNQDLNEMPLTNEILTRRVQNSETVNIGNQTNINNNFNNNMIKQSNDEHSKSYRSGIEQNQVEGDNLVSVDNVVITNHDVDEFVERSKLTTEIPSLDTEMNFNSNAYSQYNPFYPTYTEQGTYQTTPKYPAGQIQYYPLKESYPIIDEQEKDEQVNVNYNTDYSFLNPYQYPYENQLKNYVAPVEGRGDQDKPRSFTETIQIDPQKLVYGDNIGYFNQRTIQPPNYYNNRRWNNNNNNWDPRRKYSYREVVSPNRYKDKIWRSWKSTEVLIKGRNKTQPFEIELNRGNLYGKSTNVPSQYQRSPLISLNGYYGNQNTPFYVRYTN